MPRHNGTATKKTTMPAAESSPKSLNKSFIYDFF
jgi:hypothetical protein